VQDGSTALTWACTKGHAAAAQALLEGGADPDLRNKVRVKSVNTTHLSSQLRPYYV
jgi:ankyrin repeat protein